MKNEDQGSLLVAGLMDETWRSLVERDAFTAATSGVPVSRISAMDLDEAASIAARARSQIARIDQVDFESLSPADRLTAAYLRHWLEDEVRQEERWWTKFQIAPYSASIYSVLLTLVLDKIDVSNPAEADRFLDLARDYAAAIRALTKRVEAQAMRGWRLPRPALPASRKTLEGIAVAAAATLAPGSSRGGSEAFRRSAEHIVEREVRPAFAELLDFIGPDYEAAAPDRVGLCHLPGGEDAYRLWIRFNLGYEPDPADVHEVGKRELAKLSDRMAALRRGAFGYTGDEQMFHQQLRRDPRARIVSAEALETTFGGHLERIRAAIPKFIRRLPKSPAKVKRLPEALEVGITYGYYEAPTTPSDPGIYHFSAAGVPDRVQLNTAPLVFHELIPGHHVHIARQSENDALPALRRKTFMFGGFNEGWAEYAASLAEEAGLYDDPYDMYGWLAHQRYVAQRLVVDTGLNVFGWSLEQGRAFMAANVLEDEAQVASETLRYSTDLPAQALCYRMGFLKFHELRDQARDRLGEAFDPADFHEAILSEGSLPLKLLESNLADWAEQRALESV